MIGKLQLSLSIASRESFARETIEDPVLSYPFFDDRVGGESPSLQWEPMTVDKDSRAVSTFDVAMQTTTAHTPSNVSSER